MGQCQVWPVRPLTQVSNTTCERCPSLPLHDPALHLIERALNEQHVLQWVSPYAHNAHFLEGDFNWSLANWKPHWGPKPAKFQPHPTPELKLPDGPDSPNYWMYQNTWVDVNSLRPTLEKAMGLVGAQKSGGGLLGAVGLGGPGGLGGSGGKGGVATSLPDHSSRRARRV